MSAVADRGHRPPEREETLLIPADDEPVGHRHVEQRLQARGTVKVVAVARGHQVPDPAPAGRRRLSPEVGHMGLVRGPLGAGVLADALDLGVVTGVSPARERRRRVRQELCPVAERERRHVLELRFEHRRERRRGRFPDSRSRRGTERIRRAVSVVRRAARTTSPTARPSATPASSASPSGTAEATSRAARRAPLGWPGRTRRARRAPQRRLRPRRRRGGRGASRRRSRSAAARC